MECNPVLTLWKDWKNTRFKCSEENRSRGSNLLDLRDGLGSSKGRDTREDNEGLHLDGVR